MKKKLIIAIISAVVVAGSTVGVVVATKHEPRLAVDVRQLQTGNKPERAEEAAQVGCKQQDRRSTRPLGCHVPLRLRRRTNTSVKIARLLRKECQIFGKWQKSLHI